MIFKIIVNYITIVRFSRPVFNTPLTVLRRFYPDLA